MKIIVMFNLALVIYYVIIYITQTISFYGFLMLSQYDKRITYFELRDTTSIAWVMMQSIYIMNNTYKDTKNLKHKTYRIKKIKFPKFRTKITKKTRHRLCSQHRTETVPKPYRKTKKRTIRYGYKDEENQ